MSGIVERALALWGMEAAEAELAAARENRVYRVRHEGETFALRLHREGYRSDAELRSELQWMAAVDAGGLHVPRPVASVSGAFLHVVDGVQIDVVSWLSGSTGAVVADEDREALFHGIGREMARLHAVSDAWQPPEGFTRCAWDRAGLLGDAPLWGRFWENPALTAPERELFRAVRNAADAELAALEAGLDYGLIHADLVSENVMIDGGKVQLIDFDDGGFGFRLFDLATALLKHLERPNYEALKAALIGGYRSGRALDIGALDLFILLRALTYVGWIVHRMGEDGAEARNRRFIQTASGLARDYLARRKAA